VERTRFSVAAERGELAGWVSGEGPRVLAVHGGPGMNYDYLVFRRSAGRPTDATHEVLAAIHRLVAAA
jgi:hypothetical protein